MFENLSDRDIELFLWKKGTTIHKMTSQERSNIIEMIYNHRDELDEKYRCHFVGYVMHSYFFNMSVNERRYIVKMLIDNKAHDKWGDKVEMLGILYKMCPANIKTDVWNYINLGVEESTMSDIDIIAFCNCTRYIFDEMPKGKQRHLFNRLLDLEKYFAHGPAASTLTYTLNNVKKVMK